jgi:hypothetical protein
MKFNKWTVALAAAGLVSIGHNAQAEEGYISALSKTTLSGFVDTSFALSEKSSNDKLLGRVPYQNGDKMNGFSLNVVQLSLESPLDESDWAAGYKVDLLFGPDADAYDASGSSFGGIRQAYVNTRIPVGNGIDLKLGVFDAIVGYEGFSNKDNPNHTRNMAYNLQPFNHTGALASYQINESLAVQFGVADTGTNSINARTADNQTGSDGDSSYMASISYTAGEGFGALEGATLYGAYMTWPNSGVGDETTNLYIGSTLPTPIDGLALGAAYDHVENADFVNDSGNDADVFALYASYQATDKLSLHGRIEYLDGDHGVLWNAKEDYHHFEPEVKADPANNVTAKPEVSEIRQREVDSEMISYTLTAQYDPWENVLTRAEIRYDDLQEGDSAGGDDFDGDDSIVTFSLNAVYSF